MKLVKDRSGLDIILSPTFELGGICSFPCKWFLIFKNMIYFKKL